MLERFLTFCLTLGHYSRIAAIGSSEPGLGSQRKTAKADGSLRLWAALLAASCSMATAATPTITVSKTTVLTGTASLSASVPMGAASYAWTISNGAITSTTTTANSITFTAGQPGTTTLACAVVDAGGVWLSSSANVAVVAQPNATITVPGYVGRGRTFTASVPDQSGVTYAWTVSGGTISGESNLNQATFVAGTSSTTNVFCSVTNNALPTATLRKGVIVQSIAAPTLTVSIGVTPANGIGSCVPNTQAVGATYNWTIGEGASLLDGSCPVPYTLERGSAKYAKVHVGGNFTMSCKVTDFVGQQTTANGIGTATIGQGSMPVRGAFYVSPGDTQISTYLGQGPCPIWVKMPAGKWGSDVFEIMIEQGTSCMFNVPENAPAPADGHVTAFNVESMYGEGCTSSKIIPLISSTVAIVPLPDPSITAPAATVEGMDGLKASVPYVSAAGTQYIWSITNGDITAGVGGPTITYRVRNVGITTLSCKVISIADRGLVGTFSTRVYPAPIAPITVPNLNEPSGATLRTASVPAQEGASYAWGIAGGTITSGLGTNAIQYTVTAGAGGKVVLTCAVKDGSGTLTVTGTQSVSVHADLVINEIGSSTGLTASRWLEVRNLSANPLNLKDYQLRCLAVNKPGQTASNAVISVFALPDTTVNPGEFAVIRGIAYDYFQVSGTLQGLACIDSSDHTKMPYWTANGFAELLRSGSTVDFVRFGTSTAVATTPAGSWPVGASAPPLPLAYGQSIARNVISTDTNTAADWKLHTIATFGGPNDIVNDTATDGDGIPSECKAPGKTFAGLPLYDWGARPGHKDIFIHIDYMDASQSGVPGDPALKPRKEALEKVVAVFASHGYTVHFDVGNLWSSTSGDSANYNLDGTIHEVPYAKTTHCPSLLLAQITGAANLLQYKADHMAIAKKQIFHYMLFADSQGGPNAGSSGLAEMPGNDSLITLGNGLSYWGLKTSPTLEFNRLINSQAATIMHELGHNLGLDHGGGENRDYKPNYYSTMNYLYQISGLSVISDPGDRYYYYRCALDVKNHTSTFSNITAYQQYIENPNHPYPSGLENLNNGPCSSPNNFSIDFSNGSGGILNEMNFKESDGILRTVNGNTSGGIDFNGNGSIISSVITTGFDINFNNTQSESYADYDDWGHINMLFNNGNYGDNGIAIQRNDGMLVLSEMERKTAPSRVPARRIRTADVPTNIVYETLKSPVIKN